MSTRKTFRAVLFLAVLCAGLMVSTDSEAQVVQAGACYNRVNAPALEGGVLIAHIEVFCGLPAGGFIEWLEFQVCLQERVRSSEPWQDVACSGPSLAAIQGDWIVFHTVTTFPVSGKRAYRTWMRTRKRVYFSNGVVRNSSKSKTSSIRVYG